MTSVRYTNIFNAITDNPEKASELQTRADLMVAIRDIYQESKCSKMEFAARIGLTQLRSSNLLNGQIDKFSIDLLMTCLFRLGFRFKPTYKNHKLTISVQAATGNPGQRQTFH